MPRPYNFASTVALVVVAALASLLLPANVGSASAQSNADEGTPGSALPQGRFMPGEILVKFTPGVSDAKIDEINRSFGTSVIEYIEETDLYRLEIPQNRSVQQMIDLYTRHPRCEYAEPNYIGSGGDFIPDDTFFASQWHLNNIGQTGGVSDADIDAVEGWQITRGSSSVVVAVLDTGIDADHPEFQGRVLPGFDFVNEDNNAEADHPHGVFVSGIIAANSDNGFAGAGIDHAATILPVKVLGQNNFGTVVDLVQGVVFAANQGADVINMSLINYPLTAALNNALQFARDAGSILIACAGNGGVGDADVSGPGVSALTISIGATDDDDARAGFSGTGAALDLVAPGVSVPTAAFNSVSDQVSSFSGCSAATSVVSGVATLLLSIDPALTHDQMRDILAETAEDLVGPPSEDAPGRDNFFGFGRVNLNDALSEVAGPDHYLVHAVARAKGSPPFRPRKVDLEDQFGAAETLVFRPHELGNPADKHELGNPSDKNDEGIVDPETHYIAYVIRQPKRKFEPVRGVLVSNQFGEEQVLDVLRPIQLLVPSAKSLVGPVDPLEPGAEHFQCYLARQPKRESFEKVMVTIADQFDEQGSDYRVIKPTKLCNPVDKSGEGIVDPDAHLVCYGVIRHGITDKGISGIHINNQLGPLELRTRRSFRILELCVPSTKELPETNG